MTTIHPSRACSKEDVSVHARTRSKRRWDNNATNDSEKEGRIRAAGGAQAVMVAFNVKSLVGVTDDDLK